MSFLPSCSISLSKTSLSLSNSFFTGLFHHSSSNFSESADVIAPYILHRNWGRSLKSHGKFFLAAKEKFMAMHFSASCLIAHRLSLLSLTAPRWFFIKKKVVNTKAYTVCKLEHKQKERAVIGSSNLHYCHPSK